MTQNTEQVIRSIEKFDSIFYSLAYGNSDQWSIRGSKLILGDTVYDDNIKISRYQRMSREGESLMKQNIRKKSLSIQMPWEIRTALVEHGTLDDEFPPHVQILAEKAGLKIDERSLQQLQYNHWKPRITTSVAYTIRPTEALNGLFSPMVEVRMRAYVPTTMQSTSKNLEMNLNLEWTEGANELEKLSELTNPSKYSVIGMLQEPRHELMTAVYSYLKDHYVPALRLHAQFQEERNAIGNL